MKSLILIILLASATANAGTVYYHISIDGDDPSMIMCRISCPGPGGFPSVPVEFDCSQQPDSTEDCDIYIYTTTKKTLENAIRNLRGVTGVVDVQQKK